MNPASLLAQPGRSWLLVIVTVVAVVALCFVGHIPQDPSYHHFADTRKLLGISNFWNVASNLPFLVVGAFGLWRYPRLAAAESRSGYLLLCVGVCLVGLGSAYYHLAPSNPTLLWDRLPMTVVFMALLSLLLGERVVDRHKSLVLWALIAVGVCSVLYWSWTESLGRGDLRPYGLVQFLPMVLIPLILLLFRPRYIRGSLLVSAFALYVLAKLCEQLDRQIFELTRFMSGHALKHVVASLAVLCIVVAVPVRGPWRRAIATALPARDPSA
jgi:hypothetical protein